MQPRDLRRVSAGCFAYFAVLLTRLRSAPADQLVASSGTDASPAPAGAAASPARDILIGGVAFGIGVAVTAVSYSLAASGSGGGRYVIATGLLAFGLVRLVRGLARLGKT
ncbi:MAG TPA: hypothetical protein VG389_22790 [Myxococcota bacterium]|jgi:hypothetical protein|nr:hypothetical protein [Myxococcota bacterium]